MDDPLYNLNLVALVEHIKQIECLPAEQNAVTTKFI